MKNRSFSAPGSIILAGEYAMCFGKPALACAVNLSTTICLTTEQNKNQTDTIISMVVHEVKQYLKKKGEFTDVGQLHFNLTSNIPISETFGYTSARILVLVALICTQCSKNNCTPEEIHRLAYRIEKKMHQKESGIHCTTSSIGGLIYYRKEFEFLKNISSLNIKIPNTIENRLFFVDTGTADETNEELEQYIGQLYNKSTRKIESLFQETEKVTKRLVVSIAKEDTIFFKQCIEQNEEILEKLTVVTKFTQHLIRKIGAFGNATVVGLGGIKNRSGYLLAYCSEENQLKSLLTQYKISYFPFHQSLKGLEIK